MAPKKLHPSVIKFKDFVKSNPKLIQEVRKGNATWQELYEDWYLLGEDDKRWETLGSDKTETETENSTETKGDWKSNLVGMVKNMDANQMQQHINNLSQAIGAIQGVLSQFQGGNPGSNPAKPPEGPVHPFSFRKD
jgi:hypothetical protein